MVRRQDPTSLGDELVLVPEWESPSGEVPAVLVRSMTSGERATVMRSAMIFSDFGMEGFDFDPLYPMITAFTAHDPEDGARLFADSDLDWVAEMPASVITPLAQAGLRASGIDAKVRTGIGKYIHFDAELRMEFSVARELGMTVSELRRRMTSRELTGWHMLRQIEAEERAQARQ